MASSRSSGASGQPGDDLRRISGIGSVVAARLEGAGIRTYADLVRSTPEELASALVGLPGTSAGRIAAMNWIGQARRLSGETPAEPRPSSEEAPPEAPLEASIPPVLRIARVGSARARARSRAATPDEPTAVGLELRPGSGTAPTAALDYSAAIVAKRLDRAGERSIAQIGGIVRVAQGVSHAAAGPALDAGLYRLVATVNAYPPGHGPDDPPVWSETVAGDLLEVEPGVRRAIRDRLLADGVITEAEHQELQAAGPAEP
jgi:hypothetical protein